MTTTRSTNLFSLLLMLFAAACSGASSGGGIPDAAGNGDADPGLADAAPMAPDAAPGTECTATGDCAGDTPVCENGFCVACSAAGTTCSDGSACTIDDVCVADGSCSGSPATPIVYRHVQQRQGPDDVYYYSLSATSPSGFELDAEVFRVGVGQGTPLYLLFSPQADDYMTSIYPDEGDDFSLGYDPESELGTVTSEPFPGGQALYRTYRPVPLRHFTSTDPDERLPGFSPDKEFLLGYACPL